MGSSGGGGVGGEDVGGWEGGEGGGEGGGDGGGCLGDPVVIGSGCRLGGASGVFSLALLGRWSVS
jgi:hypothetical protein